MIIYFNVSVKGKERERKNNLKLKRVSENLILCNMMWGKLLGVFDCIYNSDVSVCVVYNLVGVCIYRFI